MAMYKWVQKEAKLALVSILACVRSLQAKPETMADAAKMRNHSVKLQTEPLLMAGIDTARKAGTR